MRYYNVKRVSVFHFKKISFILNDSWEMKADAQNSNPSNAQKNETTSA